MSMQAIREWLRTIRTSGAVLQHNESYVFFRPLPGRPKEAWGGL
jgi:membrane-bound lytic murein transglycosylase